MSLFSSKDANIPLLTQVYQLDLHSDEWREFYKRHEAPEWISDQSQENLEKELQLFRDVCSLAQAMMTFWQIDSSLMLIDHIDRLNKYIQQFPPQIALCEPYRPSAGVVRMDVLGEGYQFGEHSPLTAELVHHIRELWRRVKSRADILRQCQECKNSFIVQRNHPDQQYCSARCYDRVFIRNKRAKKRIDRKAMTV